MNQTIKILVFLFLIVIYPLPSIAEWKLVGSSVSPVRNYYVDFERIRKGDGYVFYWEMVDYKKPNNFGDLSTISLKQVDCRLLKYKFIKDMYFIQNRGQGKISHSSDKPDKKWSFVNPKSIGEIVLKKICS